MEGPPQLLCEMTSGEKRREFTVALRGSSTALFAEDAGIHVRELSSSVGPLDIYLRTRWKSIGKDKKVPGHICLKVIGHAKTIEEAISQFSRSALSFLPVISLATNSEVGNCEVEVAFDSSPSITERDFFQNLVPPETIDLREGRQIHPIATVELFKSIQQFDDRERVIRAINQYWLALRSWRVGHESMAVAHLWMSIEALTPVVIRNELKRHGLRKNWELAAKLGVDLKQLDPTVRRELILKGNKECYENGLAASDGLEHGFRSFDDIREKSVQVRNHIAQLVRDAILDLVHPIPEAVHVLRSDAYAQPLTDASFATHIWGKLVGTGEQLAAPGNAYPFIAWDISLNNVERISGVNSEAHLTTALKPELGAGISFKLERHEVWGR